MLLQILLEKVDMNRMYVYLHALHFNADYMALNPWELLWNSVFIKRNQFKNLHISCGKSCGICE